MNYNVFGAFQFISTVSSVRLSIMLVLASASALFIDEVVQRLIVHVIGLWVFSTDLGFIGIKAVISWKVSEIGNCFFITHLSKLYKLVLLACSPIILHDDFVGRYFV